MSGTSLDLSQIRTDALSSAESFRGLIGVYSEAEVDALIAALDELTSEDIDTLAEINAILTDANLASIAYVDGLAANYATAAQGALAATALQPSDITSGTITAGTGDIDFDDLGASSPLELIASAATETPLTVQGAPSQTANLQEWKDSSGTAKIWVNSEFDIYGPLNLEIHFGTSAHSPYIRGDDSGRIIHFHVGDYHKNQHLIEARGLVVGVQSAWKGPQCGVIGAGNRERTVLISGSNSSVDYIATGGVEIKGGVYSGGTNADGANITIEPSLGIGTGAHGKLILNNLPTSDPSVAGAVWNDGGTLKISAG